VGYKVAVRSDGRDDVVIKVEPRSLTLEEAYDGDGLSAEIEYSEAKLAVYDPAGLRALKRAWPGEDELVLLRPVHDAVDSDHGWEEVFAGPFTKVADGNGEISVAARMPDEVPPNPLTVDVQEDTDDATRQSVLARSDNDGTGPVGIAFGDGTPVVSNPGDGASGSAHRYAAAGTYTVTATSVADPTRVATQAVTVPFTG
jgi:hypothetical protein